MVYTTGVTPLVYTKDRAEDKQQKLQTHVFLLFRCFHGVYNNRLSVRSFNKRTFCGGKKWQTALSCPVLLERVNSTH